MKLITLKVTGAGGRTLAGATQGRCQACGQAVYISAAARELIQELTVEIICTICFSLADITLIRK